MSVALLPLGHFLFAALSLAWERGTRRLLLLSLFFDASLLGYLFCSFLQGETFAVVLGGWERGIGIELADDRYSLVFCFLAIFLTGAVIAYLWREHLRPYFYMLFHLLLGSVFALLFAQDLFNIYVIMELLTLVSFLLVGYERKPVQIWASLKYLFFASLGMVMYLFGVGILYYHTGTLNLGILKAQLIGQQDAPWLLIVSSLLATGIAVKAGIFVFSLWLPAAHASASPAVSALLSGLVIKMGVVVLFRLAPIFPLSLPLEVLSAITGLLGIIYAVYTYDLKRMLAFHTLSQIGYLILGIGIGTELAIAGGLEYALGHGLFKGLLFLSAGTAVQVTGKEDIPGLIARRSQIPTAARAGLLIGTLGIIGLPPFAGFCGKTLLSHGTDSIVAQTIPVILSIGTVLSFAKLLPLFHPVRGPSSPWSKIGSYAILALPMVFFLPLTRLFIPIEQWNESFGVIPGVESILIVGLGLLLYRFLPARPVKLPQRVFRLEEAVLVILSGFFLVYLLLLVG
ncbi:MAG: proton-conducting transporter membrane subunit [Candidatus Bipolaricaulota bacterium]|nr:proton-conducting transporter membrane subunit [Candidatus Bipolaricaulota bacterium]